VHPAPRLGDHQELVVVPFRGVDAHHCDVDAGDLEFRRRPAAVVLGGGVGTGEDVGQDDGLLPSGRDQAVDLAAVLGALADRVDVGIVGAQLVVDDDAPLDLEPGSDRDVGVGPHAGGNDEEVGLDLPAVGQAHAADAVGADHVGGEDVEVDGDPERLDALLEDRAGLGVELHIHEVRHGVHELDVQAVTLQRTGRLQAEQPATHHHGALARTGLGQQSAGLVDGAEPVDAGQQVAVLGLDPLHRRDERVAAGGEDEVVVGGGRAVGGVDELRRGVDPLGADAGPQAHAVVGVPVVAVEDDVALVLLAGQHRRQHDPVVVSVQLVAEDGDPELLATPPLEHFLDEASAGHPVADHHQPGAGVDAVVVRVEGGETFDAAPENGCHQTSTSPRSRTSSPVTPAGAAACSSTTVPPVRSSTTRSGT
jgi:hypothetical protein